MPRGYSRSDYSTSSSILPPLQPARNYPQGTNGSGSSRGYFDPPSPSVTPIQVLPSQMAPDGDRYLPNTAPLAFDPTGSGHGTPR